MNQKERFLNTMRFKPVDRVPMWSSGYWNETLIRWYKEGLPKDINIEELFGCDRFTRIGTYFGFCPAFDVVVLEEDERTTTYINHEGIKMKELSEKQETSMPQFLEFPVKNREDFEKVRYRLQLNEDFRFPKDWNDRCKTWKYRTIPLWLGGDRESGFFGPLRNMMGLEGLSFTFYDDPELIEDMMDNRMELMLAILDKSLKDTELDMFMFWEDMACKNGPLLSPEMFKKFMVPRYRKITDFLRKKGVDIIIVDSDGDISKLIPLWLTAGVNGMTPFEVQSGMDVVKLRKEYGNDLLMMGGIDKKVLAMTKRDIDEEIKRIYPIISKGGYIPIPDHSIPPDVPLENFLYYMTQLDKAVNC
ncbi:MAG: uroporphyrinogen decarboxylase family protein [Clostridiales bacterium]|nr:uroporphyrinogen decarboxylase family protein [Clostridiales bacterium]